MKSFKYLSGEEVQEGDIIRYHESEGRVEFIISEKTDCLDRDWYLTKSPEGGFMIKVEGFGSVFIPGNETDEDLVFVSRNEGS